MFVHNGIVKYGIGGSSTRIASKGAADSVLE